MKVLLHIAYDGTAYDGWQSQPSGRAVQDQVERALYEIFREKIRLEGASRTDAGVHAHAMPAHFEVDAPSVRPDRLPPALNHFLPDDVRVIDAETVPSGFHARFDATGKTYRYTLWNHPAMHPLHRHRAWHVPAQLDLAAMREAAVHLTGTHDFLAFTVTCPGELKDSIRTLRRCDIRQNGPEITLVIEGDSFLYKMARALAGLLVQIGTGKRRADEIPQLLQPKLLPPGTRAGVIAPAHGLALWDVAYPQRRHKSV